MIALDENLYKFGLFLVQNRKKLAVAEVTSAITGITELSNLNRKIVWDNLFYQTITLESGYAREVSLILLVGHHFVSNYASIPATDADMRKWASARVVLPAVLFKDDSNYTGAATISESLSGQSILNNAMNIATAKLLYDLANNAKLELEVYKTEFYKTNTALEKAAIDTYFSNVKTAQANATTVEYVDQFTQFTFKKYTNYTPPSFTYVKPLEIDPDDLETAFTEQTHYLLTSNNFYKAKTFDELDLLIDDFIQKQNNVIFEKTKFNDEQVGLDGAIISKCNIHTRFKKPFSYQVKLIPKVEGVFYAIMTFDVGQDCIELETSVTAGSIPQGSRYTVQQANHTGSIFVIELTGGIGANIGQATNFDIGVEMTFNNGLKLGFDSRTISPTSTISGELIIRNPQIDSSEINIPSGFGIRRLGIADYRKVEQTLCCYVPGEVSHIENVMAREYKERTTRRLRRLEETVTTTASSESENMSDTTTTSRFDLHKEIAAVLSASQESNKSFGLNSTTSGTTNVPLVGEVDFTVGSDFSTDISTSNSSELSDSESTSIAKEITEKAMNRLVRKVSEERITKMIEEFEEKNQHGIDNRKGAEHISGVFRWVDKIYKNEIRNYGRRLHYEFMIPEPAEFHLISKAGAAANVGTIPLVKPVDPRTNSFGSLTSIPNAVHINETNFMQWAAVYGATVLPPPKKHLTLGKTLLKPDDGSAWYVGKTIKDEMIIPDGYSVETVFVSIAGSDDQPWNYIDVTAAGISKRFYEDVIDKWWFADSTYFPDLKWAQASMPVSAHFIGHQSAMVNITVRLARKWILVQEWQLDTFNAIIAAYKDRLAEYQNALAELEAKQSRITADNPAYYRQIENTVLKKNCISYLTGHNYLGQDFTSGLELTNNQVNLTEAMDKYASTVKFFEQAFDWNLMSYQFYPFYWANKNRWHELYAMKNDDPIFKAFLTSGMAKVVVTVRPGFEEAVTYYMNTGLIWNGGEVPILEDNLYISMIEDLKDPEYTLEETWETRVPSTLTVIQVKTIGLNAEGLPCYCDDQNPPVEEIVQPDPNPLTNLDVFIEGDTNP